MGELKDQAIDAGLVFGFIFFSTLGGVSVVDGGISITAALVAASITASIKFFAYLIQIRGVDVPD